MAHPDQLLLEYACNRIEKLIADLRDAIAGIPDDDVMHWRPAAAENGGGEMNTLSIILAHTHGAGYWRMRNQIYSIPTNRDRDGEFCSELPPADLITMLDDWLAEFRSLLSTEDTPNLSELPITREAERPDWSKRDFAINMVEHTALHTGHAQIHRQLWLAERGAPTSS